MDRIAGPFFWLAGLIIGLTAATAPPGFAAPSGAPSANRGASVSELIDAETDDPGAESKTPETPDEGGIEEKPFRVPGDLTEPGLTDRGAGDQEAGLPSMTWSVWGWLIVVLTIILVAAYVLRKAHPGMKMFSSLPNVQVLGRTYLSPKQSLAMVKVDHRVLLLGLTEQSVSNVMTISDPDEVSRVLAQVEQQHSGGVRGGFLQFFSKEQDSYQPEDDTGQGFRSGNPGNSEENTDQAVLGLKNELHSLLNKVRRMKGMGGPE